MENLNLNIALKFARLGWKLFPCHWGNGHKPLIKWGDKASSDFTRIKNWANKWPEAYFCVALQQSNLTVLDVDNKKTKNGSQTLFELELTHGLLPETFKVSTPSGGFHHIFTGPSSVSVDKLGRGLDTPVMIPLPGTTIKGKGEYKVLSAGGFLPVPKWIQDGAGKIRDRKERDDGAHVELDTAFNVGRAIKYLEERADLSYEGDGGDLTAFKIACNVRDYGISKYRCLDLLAEHWNQRCEPPWSTEELLFKINNAYQYAQESIGKNTPEAEFTSTTPPPASQAQTISSDLRPQDSASEEPQLRAPVHFSEFTGVPPKREWLVDRLFPAKQISALYGSGGIGKSLLMLQLAINVAAGQGEFLEYKISKKMPVLAVSCEESKDETHRRIHAIKQAPEYDFIDAKDMALYIDPAAGENSLLGIQDGNIVRYGAFLADLKRMIESTRDENGDLLLILDTLSDIFAVNENDRQAAAFCIKTILMSLVKEYGCTIIVIAHPSKASIKDKIFDSGSTGWLNSFRNAFGMGPHENENLKDRVWLYHTKSNYSKREDPILLKWEKGRFIKDDESAIIDAVYEENVRLLLEAITEQCRKATPFGLHHLSALSLFGTVIKGADGKPMLKNIKKQIVNDLIKDEVIREVKAGGVAKKGLWPVNLLKGE